MAENPSNLSSETFSTNPISPFETNLLYSLQNLGINDHPRTDFLRGMYGSSSQNLPISGRRVAETGMGQEQGTGLVRSVQIPESMNDNQVFISSFQDLPRISEENMRTSMIGSASSLNNFIPGSSFDGNSSGFCMGDYSNLVGFPSYGLSTDQLNRMNWYDLSELNSETMARNRLHQNYLTWNNGFNNLWEETLGGYLSPQLISGVFGSFQDSNNQGELYHNNSEGFQISDNQGLLYQTSLGQISSISNLMAGTGNPVITGETMEERGFIESLQKTRCITEGWQYKFIMKYARLISDDPLLMEELNGDELNLLAKDPKGSIYLQRILARRDPMNMTKIFNGILGSVLTLMMDRFGYHLVQKLLDYCNLEQLQEIVSHVTANPAALINAVNNENGTISVQKLIRKIKKIPPLITKVTSALAPGVVAMMTNRNGGHLIRHCLAQLDNKQNKFLYEAALEHYLTLATNDQGCICLNNCVDCSKWPYRDALLTKLANNAIYLSQDPYGNYVVQHILGLQIPPVNEKICDQLRGNYVRLSMQKCGSHVVEKCIKTSCIKQVIYELMSSDKLGQLARDQYGNYVIQKALKTAQGELLQWLINAIQPYKQSLQHHPNGRNVFSLIKAKSLTIDRAY